MIFIRLLLPCALFLFLSGCHHGISWTPDSKGIVLCKLDGTVVSVDLESGKQNQVNKFEGGFCWPAVTPKSSEIIVPKATTRARKTVMLELHFHDREGKLLRKSKPFVFAEKQPFLDENLDLKGLDDGPEPTEKMKIRLFVSPDEKHLLATSSTTQTTVFYDLKKKTSKLFDKSEPLLFGSSPIRPDGNGCLLFKTTGSPRHNWKTTARFVTFDGKSKSLGDVTKLFKKFRDLGEKSYEHGLSGWKGKVAFLKTNNGQWSFDTEKLKASFAPTMTKDKSYFSRIHQFPNSKASLKVRQTPLQNDSWTSEVLFFPTSDATAKNIYETDQFLEFFPSPDGSKVAIRVHKLRKDQVIVFDQNGKTIWKTE